MALTAKMVTSEILMCGVKVGLKNIPVVGAGIDCAIDLVEGLQRRHEILLESRRMDNLEAQMSRVEKAMRDTINRQIQSILANLASPDLTGPVLTREIRELRHIQEQGWSPNLFEGLIRNSNHWQELKRNPHHYGRLLGDHDKVDPEKGIHLLLDAERTRVLELTPFAFARLLTHQTMGVPEAGTCASQDIWALSTQELARMVVSESNAVIAKFQWITAATVFADPYPEIDLLANRAIPLQMISELAGVYGIEVSTAQLKSIGAQMVQTELKLGLIEAATSLIAALFKSSLVGYATGAVQGVSVAYLTHMSGHAFREYFAQGQNWGEGGMPAALIRQFDLNSRAEFLQEFARQALAHVSEQVLKRSETTGGKELGEQHGTPQ